MIFSLYYQIQGTVPSWISLLHLTLLVTPSSGKSSLLGSIRSLCFHLWPHLPISFGQDVLCLSPLLRCICHKFQSLHFLLTLHFFFSDLMHFGILNDLFSPISPYTSLPLFHPYWNTGTPEAFAQVAPSA